MKSATFLDHKSRDTGCDGGIIRDSYKLPGHAKPSPALLPSPPLSRSTTTTSRGKSLTLPLEETDGCTATDSHTCPCCNRQFRRLCDLNKHAKSHVRPFKCAIPTCKYSTLGWPTRKELERHINDKHASVPQTYKCLFPECPYESKRQSNCKQHMEKIHEWTYVRSKTSGVKRPPSLVGKESRTATPKELPSPLKFPEFRNIKHDFALFPDDADHSIDLGQDRDEYHEPLDLEGQDRRDSQVFIPWTSPASRIRANATLLRRFSQAYEPSDKSVEEGTPEQSSNVRERVAGAAPTSQRQVAASSSNAHPAGSDITASQGANWLQKQLRQDEGNGNDGDDDDEDRPRKRMKPSANITIKDTEMPDIFHTAYPQIYNRDKKVLFSSCHSIHKDISTLVRHLSRPPHKLVVKERYISSFEVEGGELPHAKVGLCRRCWLRFHDRDAFERHISVQCEKTSKGKAEKWRILFDSFTPVDDPTASTQPAEPNRPLGLNRGSPSRPLIVPNQGNELAQASDQAVACRNLDGDGFVPMAEYRHLHTEFQTLKRVVYALVLERRGQGVTASPFQTTTATANPFLPQQSSWSINGQHDAAAADTSGGIPTNATIDSLPSRLDRGSLVGHMDSQSTDVDPQALLEEVRTLSRANSGVDSVRSALRHVPNSPPTRPRENPDVGPSRSAAPSGSHALPQLAHHHQPTSIPDSGYASDPKRNSIGGGDLTEHLKNPSSFPQESQPPGLRNDSSINVPGNGHIPSHQGRSDGPDHKAATTNPDPNTLMPPWTAEPGISPQGWWDPDQTAPSDPTYPNDFVHGAFPPSYRSGQDDFPFPEFDTVFQSED